jgi:hypothetical protein
MLFANILEEESAGVLYSKSETSIKIGISTQIVIKSNLKIRSNIEGEGKLVINSRGDSYIDATNKSINNLSIISGGIINLKSNLTIHNQLFILDGNLYLNDFFLSIDESNVLKGNSIHKIIKNGHGKIILQHSPLCVRENMMSNSVFVFLSNYFICPDFIYSINDQLYRFIGYYYQTGISELNKMIIVPPPQPV